MRFLTKVTRFQGQRERNSVDQIDATSWLQLLQPLQVQLTEPSTWENKGGRRHSGLGGDYEFERFSVDLELHFILVERELDRRV